MKIGARDILDPEIREWFTKHHRSPDSWTPQTQIPLPTILQLEVTKNCNLKCIMCHKGQGDHDFLRNDVSDIVLQQIKPLYPNLKLAMLFGDGEPMVYKGFWDVVRDIREASPDCCIDFINNGTMMHEQNILKCFQYGVSSMGLSLGGASSSTHDRIRKGSSLKKIVENFKLLYKMKQDRGTLEPYVNVNMVVIQSNYREISAFVDLCHEIGAYSVSFPTLFVTHPSMKSEIVNENEVSPYLLFAQNKSEQLLGKRDLKDRYFRQKNYYPVKNGGYCKHQQPWNTVYVLHDGVVVPDCHWWTSTRTSYLNECGQLNDKTSIVDVWNGPVFSEIRGKISKGTILPQCRGCGLAGGVVESYRCDSTDHDNPEYEKNYEEKAVVEEKVIFQENSIVQNVDINLREKLVNIGHRSFYAKWLSEQWNACGTLEEIVDNHVRRILKFNPDFDYKEYLDNMELAFHEELDKKSYLECSPLVVDCEIANFCNYKCLTCQSSMHKRGNTLPDELVNEVLEKLVPLGEVADYAKISELQ